MWPFILVFCTGFVMSSYPDPPSNDTISLKPDERLLYLHQAPIRECYMQYGEAAPHLAQFASSLLASNWEEFQKFPTDKKQICICETWLPERSPTQLYVMQQQKEECPENDLPEECDKFDETCIVNLWLDDPSKNRSPSLYKNKAILKCTADSSTQPNDPPKYLVHIDKMDDFDIGRRCDGQAVVQLLNYQIELYRRGSEYFWQIPIFSRDIFIENKLCDPMIFDGGLVAMRIHYKCSTDVPDLDDPQLHPKPVGFTSKANVLPTSNKCYFQANRPWVSVMLQNVPNQPMRADLSDKVCVCESKPGLADAHDADCSFPTTKYKCSETGDGECVYNTKAALEGDVSFWCDSVNENDRDDDNKPALLGSEYFPNYVAQVHDVHMYLEDTTLGVPADIFTDQDQVWNCRNPDYPHHSLTRDRQHELWSSYINQKTVYQRPNSNIHLHTIFNMKEFIEKWCPGVFDEEWRKEISKIDSSKFQDLDNYELQVKIVCKHQKPMGLND